MSDTQNNVLITSNHKYKQNTQGRRPIFFEEYIYIYMYSLFTPLHQRTII